MVFKVIECKFPMLFVALQTMVGTRVGDWVFNKFDRPSAWLSPG